VNIIDGFSKYIFSIPVKSKGDIPEKNNKSLQAY